LPPPAIGNQRHDWNTLKKGQIINGWVHQVTTDGLWIHISPYVRGRVFILDTSNHVEILKNLAEHFKPGQGLRCKVMRIDAEKQDLDLSVKALYKEPNTASTPQELKPGMIVPGRIARVILNAGLNVQLFSHTYGRVFITDISDDMKENPLEEFATRVRFFDHTSR
jgi:ribosomal protein S1